MREFKFRAWDNEYKYMNYKVLVGNVWDTDINYTAHAMWIEPKYVSYKKEAGWCHFDEHSNIELMQYTGLKDKNGVEIYEGDILSHHLQGNRFVEYGSPFKNYGGYMLVSKNGMRGTLNDSDKLYEVIGNIYENKELLNTDG